MKKIISIILMLTFCAVASACTKQISNEVLAAKGDTLYKSCLTLLQSGNGFVSASCPNSRELLNGSVALTQEHLDAIAASLSRHKPQPASVARVPGNSDELIFVFGNDNALRVYVYNVVNEGKTLLWLQDGAHRFQLSADATLYAELKTILDANIRSSEPSFDGEHISAQLLAGRDIARGFVQDKGHIASAHSSYDGKGYIDFYSQDNGEILGSIAFDVPLYRMDTNNKGTVRAFAGGKLYYINMRTLQIASEFPMPEINIDIGDNFDIDEALGVITYVQNGVVYLANTKGENSLAIIDAPDVRRALPIDVTKRLETEEAIIFFKNPRFLNGVLTAIAASNLSSQPLLALSSFPIEADISKKLASEEYVKQIQEQFSVIHFPNVFGTMGSVVGYSGVQAIISSDLGVTFSNMLSGEEWQLPYAQGRRIATLPQGIICTQTQELPPEGVRNRIDISFLSDYSNRVQVFAASSTPLTVVGGTAQYIIMREGIMPKLIFVSLEPYLKILDKN